VPDVETIIRPARLQDGDAVVRMAVALSRDEGSAESPFTAEAFRRDGFGTDPAFVGFIAERAGEAVGYTLGFRDYDTDRLLPSIYLSDLYVHESVRGTGVARALMGAIARAGRSWGAQTMAWGVLLPNARARRFYAKIGAEERTDQLAWWTPPAHFSALMRVPAPRDLLLRTATGADIPAIAAMLRELLAAHALPEPPQIEARLLADGFGQQPRFETIMAERAGAPVGYALFWACYDTDVPGRGSLLSDLYVSPAARRGGVARALMGEAARRTAARHGNFLYWFVQDDNAAALRFYATVAEHWPGVIMCIAEGPAFQALVEP
jgi:GNAT superfamily N-acetyltransferase